MRRRDFILAGAAQGLALSTSRLTLAGTQPGDSRLVLVIMRGAMDGLSAVPPLKDEDYPALRAGLALTSDNALALDGFFGLHPKLARFGDLYERGEALVVHAVATPYRERSHFDGQDVLENGTSSPVGAQDGWLNRALAHIPGARSPGGVALSQAPPLVMRGPGAVTSWAPAGMHEVDEALLTRIAQMYEADAFLHARLAEALVSRNMVNESTDLDRLMNEGAASPDVATLPRPRDPEKALTLAKAAAAFLLEPSGPRIAVLDTHGWDTHANEGASEGALAYRLGLLDEQIDALHTGLGAIWHNTVVMAVTEFGRTGAVNGTRGTDHGTATVALLAGGALRGGHVLGDWPGLGPKALYQGRDLAPTSDLRAVFKAVLEEHMGVSRRALDTIIFPNSGGVRAFKNVVA